MHPFRRDERCPAPKGRSLAPRPVLSTRGFFLPHRCVSRFRRFPGIATAPRQDCPRLCLARATRHRSPDRPKSRRRAEVCQMEVMNQLQATLHRRYSAPRTRLS